MTGGRSGRSRRVAGSARDRLRRGDRGVSVTVNYALNLVVATLLIGGVLTATGGMVENRRTSAARSELSVVGERVASELTAADRLAQAGTAGAGSAPTVAVAVSLPDRVAGSSYEVSVDAAGRDVTLVLQSDHPDVTVTVPVRNATAVATGTVRGGDLRIELHTDETPNRLEVTAR